MDMRRLVGRDVQRIRLRKRLTQEQLAEISGFSQQYISGFEKGRRNPTIITIYELALPSASATRIWFGPTNRPDLPDFQVIATGPRA